MKKLVLLSMTFLMLFSGTAFSQGINFGIKAGPNFAKYSGSGLSDYDFNSITSFHAGAFVELKLMNTFSIQPELLYSTAGSKLTNVGEEIENKLGYISVPIMARVYLIPNRLSFDFGPQASFLLNEAENVDISDSKTFDFSLGAGMTVNLVGPLFIQGRYNVGLTDVKPDASVKNNVIQLSLGLSF